MSPLRRAIGSVNNGFGQGDARRAFSRGTMAASAVGLLWVSGNLLAYGSLLMPSEPEESLLAERKDNRLGAPQASSIPNTPFFGYAEAKKQEATPEVDLSSIPVTQLNIVLSGVLDNSDKNKASALVAEKGKAAKRLFVGDSLPGGAELYSVEVDHVVLRRNGRMEKLTYPEVDGRPNVPLKNYSSLTRKSRQSGTKSTARREASQESIRERMEKLRELARERRAQRQPQ
ncbi:type II secretion system protein N [Microbulbifer echini]|uniref:Type II secretion system protein N n=1 Tax=Microbulbifer echini TaxID=1529067 RepID=A0ABV4NS40_9GAMM|nr:type II secretion system protein N [uncultured Microbulbifer sp.]